MIKVADILQLKWLLQYYARNLCILLVPCSHFRLQAKFQKKKYKHRFSYTVFFLKYI